MDTEAKISDELAAFLESGLSIVVATRDGALEPSGAAAWAATVGSEGARLTVYLYEQAAKGMLKNLESHPEIALDFDQPTTHRACQVKGLYVSSRRARPGEKALVEQQIGGLARELEEIGIPRGMTVGWKVWPCRAVELRVTQIFEQTPGPGTGEPLK